MTPKETQRAIFHVKGYIEDNLCNELILMMVEVPLIVDVESGVNDMLDRDGDHVRRSSFIFPTIAISIQSMSKSCRRRPSGNALP
jgi:asparagine synthetase A